MEKLRSGAVRVARVLREAGYEAYFAGGCVRDLLRGETPKDYDITTDARPEQVTKLFRRTLQIGAAFGVVKVLLGDGREYEVATYREDGNYADGRRPDAVSYSSSKIEDVKRRDFTINGLLMDPETGEVLDYVGGRADLDLKLVRAVGDPELRFAEDRLRMLRAVRFAVRFGFEIEARTLAAIQLNAAHIRKVSAERITQELTGIIGSPRPGEGVRLLATTGLLAGVMPFVRDPVALAARWDRLPSVERSEDRVHVAWALALDGHPASEVEDHLRASKLSKDAIRTAARLLAAAAELRPAAPMSASCMRLAAGPDAELLEAYLWCLRDEVLLDRFEAARGDIAGAPLPPRPLLSGRDLQDLGMQPGKHFKAILEAVDDAVLERRLTTKDEAIAFVRECYSRSD